MILSPEAERKLSLFLSATELRIVGKKNPTTAPLSAFSTMVSEETEKDMEEFLGKKVFLETYVKTLKNWRDQEKYFIELGLKDEDE